MPEEHQKVITPPTTSDMPMWKRWFYRFINASPIILWFGITLYLIDKFSKSLVLSEFRSLYLNIVSVAGIYNILTFLATVAIITYCNPWIRPNKIMNEGSDLTKLGLFIYWGLATLSIAIVIYAAN